MRTRFALILVAFVAIGCTESGVDTTTATPTVPAPKDTSVRLPSADTVQVPTLSEDDELRLGTEFDTQLRSNPENAAEYPIYAPTTTDKQAFRIYVEETFQSVYSAIPKSERPAYPFKVVIIEKDVAKAFAVPGGYVYVYTGIINKADNESELAGVLAHEMAHITKHHYRDAVMKQAGFSNLLDALLGESASGLSKTVASMFGNLTQLKAGLENEHEADATGTRYLGDSRRNPTGIATFFASMPSSGIDWLGTHPASSDRVKAVNSLVGSESAIRKWDTSEEAKYQARFEFARSKM